MEDEQIKKYKLALLCGLSATGKSSLISVDDKTTSYRYTTRPKRGNEIESIDGFFISEEEFNRREDLIAIHRYPDKEKGYLYGYSKKEIESAMGRGEIVAEQIVDYDAIKDFDDNFPKEKMDKTLVLADPDEIKKRLLSREKKSTNRISRNKEIFVKYIENYEKFDNIIITTKERIENTDKIVGILRKFLYELKDNKELTLKYDLSNELFKADLILLRKGKISKNEIEKSILNLIEMSIEEGGVYLYKSYPLIEDDGFNYNSRLEGILDKYHSSFTIPFYISEIAKTINQKDLSFEVENQMYNTINQFINLKPINKDNIITKKLYHFFIEDLLKDIDIFCDSKKTIEFVANDRYLMEKFRESGQFRGSETTANDVLTFFDYFLIQTPTAKKDLVPGLKQLRTLRAINFHKLTNDYKFSKYNENEKIGLFGLINFLFDQLVTPKESEQITKENYRNAETLNLIRSKVNLIKNKDSIKYSKDMREIKLILYDTITETLQNDDLYLNDLARIKSMAGGKILERNTLVTIQTTMQLINNRIEKGLNLIDKYNISNDLKWIIGYAMNHLVEHTVKIINGNSEEPLTKDNAWYYPVIENQVELIRNNWVEKPKSYEDYQLGLLENIEELKYINLKIAKYLYNNPSFIENQALSKIYTERILKNLSDFMNNYDNIKKQVENN